MARAIQRKLMPELVAGLRREVAKLPGASVISEVVQEQVVLRKLADVAPKLKNDCADLLVVALNLPSKAPKAQVSAAETASWSLSRTKCTHIYIAKRCKCP